MRCIIIAALVVVAGCENLDPPQPKPVTVDFPVIDADGAWSVVPVEVEP